MIPTVHKTEDEASSKPPYDPLTDKNMNYNLISKIINDHNKKISELFKKFCGAPKDSDERQKAQKELEEAKDYLKKLISKQKELKNGHYA